MWTLLLLSCAPKGTAHLDDLMDLGAHREACEAAQLSDEPKEALAHVSTRTWQQARVRLKAERLDEAALGAAPEAWAAWNVSVMGDTAVVPLMAAQITLYDTDGIPWVPCHDCSPEWVMQQLSPGLPVEITYEVHTKSGGNGLFRALGELVKVIALPFAIMVDFAFAPIQALAGLPLAPATRWVLSPEPWPVWHAPGEEPPDALPPLSIHVLRADEGARLPVRADVRLSGSQLGGCRIDALELQATVHDGSLIEVSR